MGFNFNDCKTTANKTTTNLNFQKTDGGGKSWEPTAATKAILHSQQVILKKCQNKYINTVLTQYSKMPITKKELNQGGAKELYVEKKGILGSVTTTSHDTPLFATYEQYITITLLTIAQHNHTCWPLHDNLKSENIQNTFSDGLHPCQLFENEEGAALYELFEKKIVTNSVTCAKSLKMNSTQLIQTVQTLPQFCWLQNSLDTFRNLSFVHIKPTKENVKKKLKTDNQLLDTYLLKLWNTPDFNTNVKYSLPGTYVQKNSSKKAMSGRAM